MSAKFDEGNTFTASIGPPLPQGEYAGTGKNEQGTFWRWRNYRENLYNRAENICTGIYNCKHNGIRRRN